jgi:hypothetical protein
MEKAMKASEVIDGYYKPGIGAATYAGKKVDQLLQNEVSNPPDWVVDRVATLLARLEAAGGLRYDYDNRKTSEPLRRKGAAEADNKVDRAVSVIFNAASGYLEFDESSEQHKLASELIESCFPEGVYPITSGRYEEQHNKCNELLSRLRGPFSEHVDKLQLGLFVDNFERLNDDYGDKLTSLNSSGVTYDEVNAAEQAAIESYFEVILVIWAAYLDDPATRNKLLAPIDEQNQRIARYHRRRNGVPAVDPDTGEAIDPDEESSDDVEPTADDADEPVDDSDEPVADDADEPTSDDADEPVVDPV